MGGAPPGFFHAFRLPHGGEVLEEEGVLADVIDSSTGAILAGCALDRRRRRISTRPPDRGDGMSAVFAGPPADSPMWVRRKSRYRMATDVTGDGDVSVAPVAPMFPS